MSKQGGIGGMNFTVEEIEFNNKKPFTLFLKGHLRQSKMSAALMGAILEIEYPEILSEKQLDFVENELLQHFSDDKKTAKEVDLYREKCPYVIHIPVDIE